ncbi:MAG TPA: LysR substrate-binding domain-containing protein [Candidatus Binataceae bacterium]
MSVKAADDLAPEYRLLRERAVDLVVGRGVDKLDDDLTAEVLYQGRVFVATGEKAPWARRRGVNLADLIEYRGSYFPKIAGSIPA